MYKFKLSICAKVFILLVSPLIATAQPRVISFSPGMGPAGTSVNISGINFNALPENNIVYFGAIKAIVNSGNTTNLVVTVPTGATPQPISVLNNATGLTGYSANPFITTFANFYPGVPPNFYRPKVDFPVNTNPRNVAVGDFDSDGRADLAVTNGNSDNISILHNTGLTGNINTSLFFKVDFASGTFLEFVAVGDVDGDGRPDLIFTQSGSIAVMRNTHVSGFITASSFAAKVNVTPLFSGGTTVAIGDIDGDGKPELVSANSTANTVSVVRNTSIPGTLSFLPKVDFSSGVTPSSVAVSDIDGDGKPDIVTTNAGAGSNSVSVLRNTSTSGVINGTSFAIKVDFSTGSSPTSRSVAVGDIDGDGKADLVVANSGGTSTLLSILRNTATSGTINSSSFAAKVDFTTGTSPVSVAIGGLDGDGKPDIVVANVNSNNISVLRNIATSGSIGTSSLSPKVDFATGNGPVSVVVGDFNGDGIADLAVANGTGSSVSVFQPDNAVLPLTISNVKAYQKNDGVQVEWTTHQDGNVERFEVEKSQSLLQFLKMGVVSAKGNAGVMNYSLFDPSPADGLNFYRLKIIDKSGQYSYDRIIRVNINNRANAISIYPNPVKGNIISLTMNLQKGKYTVTLINKLGQRVITKAIDHLGGSANENIELANGLAPGVYQLRLSGDEIDITRQVLKR